MYVRMAQHICVYVRAACCEMRLRCERMMAAYEHWHASAVEKKAMAAKAKKVIFRWVNQCVGQSMAAWYLYTEEEARKRNEERTKEARGKAVMQRVVKRMQHATLASGPLRWCERVEKLRRQQGIYIGEGSVAYEDWCCVQGICAMG